MMPDFSVAIIGTGFAGIGMAVWVTGGCRSWYLNDAGRNVSPWPDFTWAFAWQIRRFDVSSYEVRLPHP